MKNKTTPSKMNIVSVYKQFPTQDACIDHLERVKWQGEPNCPYCGSLNATKMKNERRYHCNDCNTSYSVTVKTIFHNTKLDLQKWFLAIAMILNAKKGMSARQLARHIDVNKNTAWYMGMRIRKAMTSDGELLEGIVEMDETYVGGKPRKGDGEHHKRGRGTKKEPVVGLIERDGSVKASHVENTKGKTLRDLVRKNVNVDNALLITDEYKGYLGMAKVVDHQTIEHKRWYVDGAVHTNTIESFWALLKRGVIGQYHKVSAKYLDNYINEFCFRFNGRKTDNMFDLTIERALGC